MTDPSPRPPRLRAPYLALFVAVYAVQGVVYAFFANFILGYLHAGGVPENRALAVQGAALTPFLLKFLAGPVSDRFPLLGLGHRRPYILLGLLVQGFGLVGLAAFGRLDGNLGAFTAVAILTVIGLALYDTCTDGLIVDLTPPADRARVQGLVMGARFGLATLCSVLFGAWLERTGTGPGKGQGVLLACAALSILPLILAALLPEPTQSRARSFDWSAFGVMLRPRSLALLAFGAFYAVMAMGLEFNLAPFYERMGYGPQAIGQFAAVRNLGRAGGSLLLPIGMLALGRRWTMRIAILGLATSEALQGLAAPEAGIGVALLGALFGLASGWTDALFYVLAMEASDPRMAASTYALFMAASNVSVAGGVVVGGLVSAFDGRYPPAFTAAALLTVPALAMVWPLAQPPVEEPRPDA